MRSDSIRFDSIRRVDWSGGPPRVLTGSARSAPFTRLSGTLHE